MFESGLSVFKTTHRAPTKNQTRAGLRHIQTGFGYLQGYGLS
jgi:hypothetical protein